MIVHQPDTVNELPNAYTYYLEEKLGKLYSQMLNKNVSVEDMKKNVYNYIWNSVYSFKKNGVTVYTKKKWFVETLRELESKKQIYFLCRNSVKRARETEAR
jgi:hypothetical protein